MRWKIIAEGQTTKTWRSIIEWIVTIVLAFTVAMLFHNYVYAQTKVQNHSMENTLFDGERLIIDKWSYYFNDPKHGDIVIIDGPEYKDRIVKRVIAVAGDELEIRDGLVFVNDKQLHEPYLKGITVAGQNAERIVIPDKKVFVMGDNRERSTDSRSFGFIAHSSIEGKAVFRIWPFDRIGILK